MGKAERVQQELEPQENPQNDKDTGVHNVFVTLGASNHTTNSRESSDFYATDPIAMELLLNEERFDNHIWECACGAGHLSKVLEGNGYDVKSTDIVDHGFGENGVDFLTQNDIFDGDIITNPPYKYAAEFVTHALKLVNPGHKVAMFLRLNFLEGKARRKLFDAAPPKMVYVASGRINCCKEGDFSPEGRKKHQAIAYAWFVWEKDWQGVTGLKWIN